MRNTMLWLLPNLVLLSLVVLSTQALAFASKDGRTSIVTGASGYVGKAIVHELVDQGQPRILCLVRCARVASEEKYWRGIADAEKIKSDMCVLPYDMTDGGATLQKALDEAADDSCCIYHVASNFGPTEHHIEVAHENVKGTKDLVHTVAAHSQHHKIVFTSSMAAVRGTGQDPKNGRFYTEEDWNTASQLGTNWGSSYQWSKAESEQQAIALAKLLGVSMVTLCPSFVFGPPRDLASSNSYSIDLVGQWARGESPVQSRLFVDVRDVAAAHVAAGRLCVSADTPARYIVSTEARVPSREIAGWMARVCEQTGMSDPKKVHFDDQFQGGAIAIGGKEVGAEVRLKEELGVTLHPVQDTIISMAQILLERGVKQR